MKKAFKLSVIFLVCLFSDILTKHIALLHFQEKGITVVNTFLKLTYKENPAGVFGIFQKMDLEARTIILIFIMIGVGLLLTYIIIKTWKWNSLKSFLPLILIISGAIGNALDLITKGYVVDFIQLPFVTCNFADIYAIFGSVSFSLFYPIHKNIILLFDIKKGE